MLRRELFKFTTYQHKNNVEVHQHIINFKTNLFDEIEGRELEKNYSKETSQNSQFALAMSN